MAELAQPARYHRGAHLFAVEQHHPCPFDADPLIRRLHELAAGGMGETRQAVGLELLGCADIGCARGIGEPGMSRGRRDESRAARLGNARARDCSAARSALPSASA
jgi:hypothetical protein